MYIQSIYYTSIIYMSEPLLLYNYSATISRSHIYISVWNLPQMHLLNNHNSITMTVLVAWNRTNLNAYQLY